MSSDYEDPSGYFVLILLGGVLLLALSAYAVLRLSDPRHKKRLLHTLRRAKGTWFSNELAKQADVPESLLHEVMRKMCELNYAGHEVHVNRKLPRDVLQGESATEECTRYWLTEGGRQWLDEVSLEKVPAELK